MTPGIKFKATKEQLLKIATLAVNAAKPFGMGFMHHVEKDYTEQEVDAVINCGDIFNMQNKINDSSLDIDYFRGRMCKLYIRKKGDFFYCENETKSDYQSWNCKYKTYMDLLKAAGITDIQEDK
jgi:hypothetical protein